MIAITAIGGTAGVGKTALAVHWAHQVAARFPDGQLYVNLRGYDPGQPMTPADALAGFLRALGVAGQDIPVEEAERAARYRSMLPGSPACVVVVTSRNTLAGLVARDGAERLDLDVLPAGDAVGLLRALIGARVDADPEAAAELAVQCCRLPLALRVAAELAASRPAVPLAGLVGELADQHKRLDLLEAGGDPHTAVRTVFSWSYRHLDAAAARTFRLLGLHPGADLTLHAAAALTETSLVQAGYLLDQLPRAHLIQSAAPGRYGMHDLLRAYARDLAATADSDQERREALTRLFDCYLYTASIAMDALYAAEPHRRPRVSRPGTPVPLMPDSVAAREWLDAERATLVAVMAHTAEHGWVGHATALAATVFRYLDGLGYNPEALSVHSYARIAARQAGDRAAEAISLNGLAAGHWRQGHYEQATGCLQEALALFLEANDQVGQAQTMGNLGILHAQQGRYELAASLQEQVLALWRETGNRGSEMRALGNLGTVEERRGRYEQAVRCHQQSLALARKLGDRRSESYALMNLGKVGLLQGRYRPAIGQIQQALVMFREVGDKHGEAEAEAGPRRGPGPAQPGGSRRPRRA